MNELVSVIVPIYKVEAFLDRCIRSIIHQTYRNLEIFLVDDGSPDNCPEICDAWTTKDSRITVIHKANGGLSDARNAALDVATGDYITFVDSDDLIAPNAVELLVETARAEKSEIVISTNITKFSEEIKPEEGLVAGVKTLPSQQAIEEIFCCNTRWEAWGTIYQAKLFEAMRFPKGKLYEDIYCIPQIVLLSKNVTFLDAVVYYYYERPDSIMRANGCIVKEDLYDAVKKNLDQFDVITNRRTRVNAKAGILEELVSRIHFAYGSEVQNKAFIKKSKRLVRAHKKDIVAATKIPFKRKLFMFLVMSGISKHIKRWN